jgi:hypothetical protein
VILAGTSAEHGEAVFADQSGAMQPGEFEYFLQRLAGRRVRESVLALVDAVISGLEARSVGHSARA